MSSKQIFVISLLFSQSKITRDTVVEVGYFGVLSTTYSNVSVKGGIIIDH